MKTFVRKRTRIKKRRAITKAIVAYATGLAYKVWQNKCQP